MVESLLGVNNHEYKMNWDAYVISSDLTSGAVLEVYRYLRDNEDQTTPAVKDKLTIEFPDNTKENGCIQDVLGSTIVVSRNGLNQSWDRQGNGQINPDRRLVLTYIVK